ncbi:GAP family protein [Salinispora vitiensis]|uniref:GAP family protein n=1 Tax=Salinispora vitiensis TaxID=999544 RepID=UPI0003A28B47|nr:GAP family protein [Salinispora vitiensis]
MVITLATIFGLALVDSLSPAMLAVSLYFVLKTERYVSRVAVYVATVVTVYLGLGIALMLGFGALADIMSNDIGRTIVHILQVVVGVSLLIYSIAGGWSKKPAEPVRRPTSQRIPIVIGLALSVTLAEFLTALPYFGAVGILAGSDFTTPQWLSLLIAYNIVAVLPTVAIVFVAIILRERQRERFQRWLDKLSNSRGSWLTLVGIAGFLLARNGAAYLVVDFGLVDGLVDIGDADTPPK